MMKMGGRGTSSEVPSFLHGILGMPWDLRARSLPWDLHRLGRAVPHRGAGARRAAAPAPRPRHVPGSPRERPVRRDTAASQTNEFLRIARISYDFNMILLGIYYGFPMDFPGFALILAGF